MTGKIKVLDEKVISQIAAGEVIEKPASVIKELLENSIDAQATWITIEVTDGGKKSIKVSDDGIGIDREDAEKVFLRYSTSKIESLRDLESIISLGFRGEALASIASVAKVTLITKPQDVVQDTGTKIYVEGGKVREISDTAASEGTTVLVEDLFYNTPARRKYMKSTRAELAKITDIVTRQALNYPEIFFKLLHNKEEIIKIPKTTSSLDNIAYIYGMDIAKEMLQVKYSDLDLEIQGFTSKPAQTRNSTSHISIFVNKRYITSKLLTSALKEGYHNLIMKNRFPIAIISMKIHPRKIDVNVHPSKLEIRFEDEKKVYSAFISAIEDALSTKSLIPDFGSVDFTTPEITALDVHSNQTVDVLTEMVPVIETGKQAVIETYDADEKIHRTTEVSGEGKDTHIPKMTLVGQILNTYIVAQSGENILIIDQHAAHERVLFERLIRLKREDKKDRQSLLSPLTIELNPKQKNFITTNSEIMDSLGFRMEHFGGNTFQIRALPVVFGSTENPKVIHDIIDELLSLGKTKHKDELLEKAAAIVACHSAIRGGDELSFVQMKNLVESLYETENAYSCPHGRPSILSMTKYELEKRFKRK